MNEWEALLAVGDNAAYQSGRLIGLVFWTVVIFLGISKCIGIMRRPTTSKLCVIPLLLILLNGIVGIWWNMAVEDELIPAAIDWISLVIRAPLLFTAFILAIVGLCIYDAQKFNQGKKQAVWGLILSSTFLVTIFATSFATPLQELAEKLAEETNLQSPGETTALEEWNFSITPPDKGWTKHKPKIWNSLACASFSKNSTDTYFIVMPEKSPILMMQEDEIFQYLSKSIKDFFAAKDHRRPQQEETLTLNGQKFVKITTVIWNTEVKMTIYYEHWLTANKGHTWQMVFWGGIENEHKITENAKKMMQGFRILDRDRTAPLDIKVNANYPELGFQVEKLAEKGWRLYRPKPNDEDAHSALIAYCAETMEEAVIVMPAHHQIPGPPPTLEALAKASLAEYDFDYNRHSQEYTTRKLNKPYEGLEISFEKESEGDLYRYLFRVFQSDKHAWVLGGWKTKKVGTNTDSLRAAMDNIRLTPPTGEATKKEKPGFQKALANWHNRIGLWYHTAGKYKDSERYFRDASQREPEDQTMFDNISHSLENQKEWDKALTMYETGKKLSFGKSHSFLIRLAWLQIMAKKPKEGAQQILALIKEDYHDNDQVLNCINALLENEKYDEAVTVADAYAKAHPEQRPRLWQAQVANHKEDYERSLKLFEALIKDEPDYVEAQYSFAELSNREGKHERALDLVAKLEEADQSTARLHLIRGWAHMGRKWYKDAKLSFEKAAQLEPNNENVKYALQDASAHLGQGSNTEIKTPLTLVPLPKGIQAQLKTLSSEKNETTDHNTTVLLWARCIHYTPKTPMRTTLHRMIRIHNDEGARDYSTLNYQYDPLVEKLYVNRVEVIDTEGKVISQVKLDDVYVMDSGKDSMATTDRNVKIQIPGLKPGCTLHSEVTIEKHSPNPSFSLLRHLFAAELPVKMEVLSLEGDVSNVSEQLVNPEIVKISKSKDQWIYAVKDSPLISSEPYRKPDETWAPVLTLVGEKSGWDKVAKDYLTEIAPLLKKDDNVENEAKKLTEGITDAQEKVRILATFVQKSVRYKAIEFGVRGHIPAAPAVTLQQRYGDCKDQALLLHHLLRACDIPSHLVLINTQWKLDLTQPTMDAFNHAIVYVPMLKNRAFIDTTSSSLAITDFTPYALWGQSALVLNPDKPQIIKVPETKPSNYDVTCKRHIALIPEGKLRITEEMTLQGYYASGMRYSFINTEPKDRFQHAQSILNEKKQHHLEDFEFINLTDPSKPAILRMTYTLPNAVEKRGDTHKITLPTAWEDYYLDVPFIRDRKTDFLWKIPFSMQSTVTLDASLQASPEHLVTYQQQQKTSHGHWSMKADKQTLNFDFKVAGGQYPAVDYAPFHHLWSSARDLWHKELNTHAAASQ